MSSKWTANAERLAAARATLDETLRELRRQESAEASRAFVSACGRLCLLGDEERVAAERDAIGDGDRVVALGRREVAWEALDSAANQIATLAPDLELTEGEAQAALETRITAALEERHRVETWLLGAERLLGGASPLDDEQAELLTHFDMLVSDELWRLIPMSETRAERALEVRPELRARCWWWSRGADVPVDGLEHLSGAALVLHRFPEARERLERLIRGQDLLDSLGQAVGVASGGGEVVSLADWIAAKRAAVADVSYELDEVVGMSADGRGTVILAQTDRYVLSWLSSGKLVVAASSPLEAGRVPQLTLGARTLLGHVVSAGDRRFSFDVTETSLPLAETQLHIPFADGPITVTLGA